MACSGVGELVVMVFMLCVCGCACARVLLQVVQFDPSVLLLSPGQLAEETQQFKLLACSHPVWQAEFK